MNQAPYAAEAMGIIRDCEWAVWLADGCDANRNVPFLTSPEEQTQIIRPRDPVEIRLEQYLGPDLEESRLLIKTQPRQISSGGSIWT